MADIMTLAKERFNRAYEFDRDNQEEMIEDLEFRIGRQWPAQIERERQEAGRPCLTINRMPQFINQVVNDIRLNSPSIKVVATEDAHQEIAEIYTGLIRSIEDRSDASIAYETAAEGAATCGIGHFRIRTEYSTDGMDDLAGAFDLDIRISRIADATSVLWDPDAHEFTKEDAAYCFVGRDITTAEFKDQFPEKSLDPFEMEHVSNNQAGWYSDTDKIRIAEYWTKETTVERTIALLETGEVVALNRETRRALKETGVKILRERKVEKTTVKYHLISGSEVLEGPIEFPSKFIPIVSVIGDEVHIGDAVVRSGLVRPAKDPQRMYNYWRTASTEAIALAPKAPYLLTTDQIKGMEDQWAIANRQNLPYLVYKVDPKGAPPPMRQDNSTVPVGMLQETATAAEDMKAVTGIYDASLGNSSAEKSGKAILARERQGDVGTFQYADNLRRALTYAGKILVDMIPRIYDTERTIRILGPDNSEKFEIVNMEDDDGNILNNLSAGKYEVSVTTGPSFSTQREEARESMMAFAKAVPQAGVVTADLIAKNMDWPGADELAQRLRKIVPPGIIEEDEDRQVGPDGQPIPTPAEQQQMQAMQMQQQIQQLELQKLAAEAEEATAKAKEAGYKAKMAEAELVLVAKRAPQEDEQRDLENMETEVNIALKQKQLNEPTQAL